MSRPHILAAVGVVVVAAAIGLIFFLDDDQAPPPPQTPMAQQEPMVQSPPSDKPAFLQPRFDVVRINPQGDTVMAGRATPKARVEIRDGDKVVGEVIADDRGEWVFVPSEPLPAGSRELSLRMYPVEGETVDSEDVVVLVVPERHKDLAGQPTERPTQALALKVARDGRGASKIMQKPVQDWDGKALVIDIVDYDEEGRLIVSGRSQPKAAIKLYLNNNYRGGASSDEQGAWSVKPEEPVAPGIYTLRADHVDEANKVLARAEIPFSRAEPFGSLPDGDIIIVQPGNSLWRLARRTLGSGYSFSVIYEANKNQIKDPDLIYPGQIFSVPKR